MKGKGLGILKWRTDGSWRVWRGINNMTRIEAAQSTENRSFWRMTSFATPDALNGRPYETATVCSE